MTAEMVLTLIHRLFWAVGQGRLTTVDQCLAPSFRLHDPSLPGVLTRAESLALLRRALEAPPLLRVTIEDEVAADGRIAVRYDACAAEVGEHGPATSQAKASGMLMARCEGGRVLEMWHVSHTPVRP